MLHSWGCVKRLNICVTLLQRLVTSVLRLCVTLLWLSVTLLRPRITLIRLYVTLLRLCVPLLRPRIKLMRLYVTLLRLCVRLLWLCVTLLMLQSLGSVFSFEAQCWASEILGCRVLLCCKVETRPHSHQNQQFVINLSCGPQKKKSLSASWKTETGKLNPSPPHFWKIMILYFIVEK